MISLLSSPYEIAFGQGVGRFAIEFYRQNVGREQPSAFQIVDDETRYLKLTAARYPAGYGDVIRFGQRISSTASYPLTFKALVHSSMSNGHLVIEVCDKWLLYPSNCSIVEIGGIGTTWAMRTVQIPGQQRVDNIARLTPREFSLSTGNTNAAADIDITAIQLFDANQKELLDNGKFDDDFMHWSYTSDRQHLPWHAKNMWLNLYFEQGLCGSILYSLLLLSAVVCLANKAARGNREAPPFIAAIAGICAVGLFDSLLDFTPIACLVFILLWLSMMNARLSRRRSNYSTTH